ncbi:benzoylformate decarboxylase [Gordonia sp. HNM0687]|uniref:acetolactate synthase n=1 Tax=Gordonia mangrovi TaxID=2665643 RepID=A0A6L7GRY9_9ACTN|nr:benzoylformate decarboxylase [Gordonia mangrovi]MXP22640.1 benzoylformate decarboxylase [Gordonia mangrovi]UVF77492.1 benzoylformate decarboxylase [Gordonia mangrovi]
MNVRDVTHQLLRELGLTTVFGNPGSTEETFLKNFPSDFRFVLALQEASALAIADGYSQGVRRPVLVNVHTAAGLGNAMGNLITASMNRTPLIVTAGQQTREMLLLEPWLTNVEPELLPRPWVKWAYQPVRAEDVPAAFMRAYAAAVQPPAGPVFLSLPLDDWEKPAIGPAVVRSCAGQVAAEPARLREFASAIDRSERPVLIYGAAVARDQAWDVAVELAEKVGAPVWAAPASERAPFPEDHPLYVGGLPFATGPLAERLRGHDLAVIIGAPVFRYYPYVPGPYLPDGLRLLHITDDPGEAARAPVGDSLVSSAGVAIEMLIGALKRGRREVEPLTPQEHRMAPHPPAPATAHGDAMSARQLFRTLRGACAADTVVVEESPSNLSDLHAEWPITSPDSFYTFASGGLGWNLPASVGIALAEADTGRHRPVLAIVGDGSFQYSVQSIWTAAQHRLDILFVVPRNGEYAILKSFAELEDTPGVPGLDVPGIDFVALARAYGCHGVRALTPEEVAAEVSAARDRSGPTLLEVPITAAVPSLL